MGQRAGDRRPLSLADRDLARLAVAQTGKAQPFQQRDHATGIAPPGTADRQLDVLPDRQERHQPAGLQDVAQMPAAQLAQPILARRGPQLRHRDRRGFRPDPHLEPPALVRPENAGHHVEAGALARPAAADDGDGLAGRDREVAHRHPERRPAPDQHVLKKDQGRRHAG